MALLLQPPSCDLSQTLHSSTQPRPHAHCSRLCSVLPFLQKPNQPLEPRVEKCFWGENKSHKYMDVWPNKFMVLPLLWDFPVDLGSLWMTLAGVLPYSLLVSGGGIHFLQHNFRRIHPRVYRIPSLIQVILKWLKRLIESTFTDFNHDKILHWWGESTTIAEKSSREKQLANSVINKMQ